MPAGDLYRFVIADINGVEQEEVPAQNPTWSYVLNDAGSASLTLPSRHPMCTRSLFALNKAELHIYYQNTLIWGGHLYSTDGTVEADVRFGFESWFSRLKRRYIDVSKKYDNQDTSFIAWDLINWSQSKTNGAIGMGWTRGTVTTTGILRTIYYPFWERTIISEAITDMAEMASGFDFDVTPQKVFRVYYPSRGSVLTIPLEYGKNMQSFSLQEDGTDTANTYTAIGAGDGKNTCIAVAVSSADQAAYGLLEKAESFTNIKHFNNLSDKATEGVRMNKVPRVGPNVTTWPTSEPDPTLFNVGDRVPVICKEGYFNFNQTMRIISKVFALSNEGRAAISYQFDDKTDV